MNTMFHVLGMTCGGCEQSVSRIICQHAEVADVIVDRGRNQATVSWKAGVNAQAIARASSNICEAVSAAGFDCSTS